MLYQTKIFLTSLILLIVLDQSKSLEFVKRDEWGAKPPKDSIPMPNPVPYVIIHHSYIPAACNSRPQCIEAMQWMQDYHQNNQSWDDIGYSFAVGGDDGAYIGRGWDKVGAHAPSYNDKSIGICIIGDWTSELPAQHQLDTVFDLIQFGVDGGYIMANYSLMGHRQVREGTECPGDTLYEAVTQWDHYQPFPDDLQQ